MITSVNNGQVKNVIQLNQKAKARREQGLFAAEGKKMFQEAPAEWISKVYVAEALSTDEGLMERVKQFPYEIVTDSVFRQMSDTQTPQGILTLLRKPFYTMEDILKRMPQYRRSATSQIARIAWISGKTVLPMHLNVRRRMLCFGCSTV